MKLLVLLLAAGLLPGLAARAQSVNCSLYPVGSACRQACELYESPPRKETMQGSAASQQAFDQVLALCPSFAPALREKAVPYLKRGDFGTWKRMIDEVVRLQPAQYLGYRGWCCFHFLRDYETAAADLTRLSALTHGRPGYSNDGDYDLRIVLALSQRELGYPRQALATFDACLADNEAQHRVGLYDYLHRGVTRLQQGDYAGAVADLQREQQQIKELAETHYYLGLAYQHLQQSEPARQQLRLAARLFRQNKRRRDSYSESLDVTYLETIEEALAALR